jgi:hypothetical protein
VVLRSSGDSYVNGGNFGVGITTPTSAKLMVVGSATAGLTDVQVAGGPNASDTTTKMVQFYDAAFNTVQGAITRNGSNAVAYGTASDGRLKDGVTDSEVGLDALLALKVRDYVFEGDARVQQGLLAQEVADVYPVAVHEGGDDPAKDPWMIDYGRLTPLLIRAIQQQQAEIERLKRRLDRR